ncbi:MAG: M67 family metallopeptidase [bacterium]|nr:M67 family metallopeptidase [bacterium]
MRLMLSHSAQTDLIQHAKTGYPEEVCGLLVGHGEQISRVIPTENGASDKRNSFLIPQQALNQYLPKIRAEGLNLIGFYHSHPNTAPILSPTDVRELDNGLKLPHIVVGVAHHYIELKAWFIEYGQVTPVEMIIGEFLGDEPQPITSSAQKIAFLLSVMVSLALLITIAISLLPPAPELP